MARQPRGPDGRFVCVPTYPRLRTSACGCGGGGEHPCPIGRKLRPLREAAKRAYRPPRRRFTSEDLEDVERDLYGNEIEQGAVAEELAAVRAQVRDVGGLGERGMRGRSAKEQARYAQELRNRNRALGKGYSARDVYGEESEQGYVDLLERRAQLIAHQHHLKSEAADLTRRHRAISRAVERGTYAASTEARQALGWTRRRHVGPYFRIRH